MGRALFRKNASSSSENAEDWTETGGTMELTRGRDSCQRKGSGGGFWVSTVPPPEWDKDGSSLLYWSNLDQVICVYLSPPNSKLETNCKARLRERVQKPAPLGGGKTRHKKRRKSLSAIF